MKRYGKQYEFTTSRRETHRYGVTLDVPTRAFSTKQEDKP